MNLLEDLSDIFDKASLTLANIRDEMLEQMQAPQMRRLLRRYREKVVQFQVRLQKLIERLKQLTAGPAIYATVVIVRNSLPNGKNFNYAALPTGTKVKIISGRLPHHQSQTGYVLDGTPDKNGEVAVAFEDGGLAYFGIGIVGKNNALREIELVAEDDREVIVALEGRLVALLMPPEETAIVPGDTVRLSPETKQIICKVDLGEKYGQQAIVERIISDQRCTVTVNDSQRVVFTGKFSGKINVNDQVLVDPSQIIILDNFGQLSPVVTANIPRVTWEEVGGQEKAVEILRDIFVSPIEDQELLAFHCDSPLRGGLFYGPGGCGKNHVINAALTFLVDHYGEVMKEGIVWINGPDLFRPTVGSGEDAWRRAFAYCKAFEKRTGIPGVMVVDECEVPLKKRGMGISTDVNEPLVDTFLTQVNGLEGYRTTIILLTNREDILDPAVIRHNRIDIVCRVGRPDQETIVKLFQIYLKKFRVAAGLKIEDLAVSAAAELFSPGCALVEITVTEGEGQAHNLTFTYGHLGSGAMVATLVKMASKKAIQRDKAAGTKTGITAADLKLAIQEDFVARKELDYTDDLKFFARDLSGTVKIQKLYQGRKK